MGNSSSQAEIVLIDRPDKVYYAGETVYGFLSAPEDEVLRLNKASIALIGKVHLSQDANIDPNVIRYLSKKYMMPKAREFFKQKYVIYKRKEMLSNTADTSTVISEIMMEDDGRLRSSTGQASFSSSEASDNDNKSEAGWCPTFSFELPSDLPSYTDKPRQPAVIYTIVATLAFANTPKYMRHLNIRVLAKTSQPEIPLVIPQIDESDNVLRVASSPDAYSNVQCTLIATAFENVQSISMVVEQTPALDDIRLKSIKYAFFSIEKICETEHVICIYKNEQKFNVNEDDHQHPITIFSGSSLVPPTHEYISQNTLIHISRRYQIELVFKFSNGKIVRKTWPIQIYNTNASCIHKN